MKPSIFSVLLIAALSLGLGACTPESLEGFDDPSNVSTNNSTNSSTPNGGTGGNFTPEFLAVHGIMVGKCALAGCHGPNSAGGNFLVPAGTNAQPAELQAAFENTLANASGDLLIEPGASANSDIYNRLNATPPLLMPTTGSLPQGEIDTIRTWIDNGAVYTQ